MSGFRLLGIRTGNSLTEEEIQSFDNFPYVGNSRSIPAPYNYLKNLEPNETFLFFNDYTLDKSGSILTYLPEKSIPEIYTLKKNSKTKLTISTIVGKNGSGKSTLLEILYVAIHNLAVATDVLYDSDMVKVEDPQSYLRCELYILTDEKTSYKIKFDDKAKRPCIISTAKKDNNVFKYQEIKDFDKKILKKLFYSIAVNYSIYGLNSKYLGSWITHLFHKNDSYKTPLVINPMRTEGNFDINREEYLSKYRLLSNSILKYKPNKDITSIIDDIRIKKLIFKLDQNKINFLEYDRVFKDSSSNRETYEKTRTIQKLIDDSELEKSIAEVAALAVKIILKKEVSKTNIPYKIEAEKYIVKKLYRIAFNYNRYWNYLIYIKPKDDLNGYPIPVKFEALFKVHLFEDYLKKLVLDNTHVTLKLRQALNYLVNNPLDKHISKDGITKFEFKEINGGRIYEIPFEEFAERLLTFDDEVIRCIPPSLFDISVIVSDDSKKSREDFDMKYLSSGQLQLIHSIQSSLYHINNLESYKLVKDELIKYENVLIIFDEIELYFHPEYQRKIVNFFIEQLDELNFKQVKNFHVIYITHSPFVLSDIPHTNQLILSDGKPIKSERASFAANIHDLLANDFFLKDGFMGEFAKNEIKNVIEALNYTHLNSLKIEKQEQLKLVYEGNNKNRLEEEIKVIEIKLKQALKPDKKYDKGYCKNVINVIGEPILYMSLMELYSLAYKNSKQIFIDEQIQKLNNLR